VATTYTGGLVVVGAVATDRRVVGAAPLVVVDPHATSTTVVTATAERRLHIGRRSYRWPCVWPTRRKGTRREDELGGAMYIGLGTLIIIIILILILT
jgi:hypothetical protein